MTKIQQTIQGDLQEFELQKIVIQAKEVCKSRGKKRQYGSRQTIEIDLQALNRLSIAVSLYEADYGTIELPQTTTT